jgi:hypothetical protein
LSKNKNLFRLLLSIGFLLIPVAIYSVPLEWLKNQHSVCLFRNLTGYECYGCGMTRAVFSAIHFRFEDAFHFNKLFIIVLPLLIYIWAKTILSLWPWEEFLYSFFVKSKKGKKSERKRLFLNFY